MNLHRRDENVAPLLRSRLAGGQCRGWQSKLCPGRGQRVELADKIAELKTSRYQEPILSRAIAAECGEAEQPCSQQAQCRGLRNRWRRLEDLVDRDRRIPAIVPEQAVEHSHNEVNRPVGDDYGDSRATRNEEIVRDVRGDILRGFRMVDIQKWIYDARNPAVRTPQRNASRQSVEVARIGRRREFRVVRVEYATQLAGGGHAGCPVRRKTFCA